MVQFLNLTELTLSTRFQPNRPAADMREMEGLIFLVISENFWRIFEDLRILEANMASKWPQTADEICAPNDICYSTTFFCLLGASVRSFLINKEDESASTRPVNSYCGHHRSMFDSDNDLPRL